MRTQTNSTKKEYDMFANIINRFFFLTINTELQENNELSLKPREHSYNLVLSEG